jgi:LuxR family transcriptional regulator, maltose regulon positive regulatory protein
VTPVLLHTKLLPPRPRPSLIHRATLLDKLAAGQQGKLSLVSAPAGFGKTTLVAHFVAGLPGHVCWLSLDTADDDAPRFLAYIIAALQTAVPTIGHAAAELLAAPPPLPLETILTLLCNELNQVNGRFTLVLDDYHVITQPAIHQAIAFWLAHLPPNLHLILTSRAAPPLSLPRLRARGQLTELRADDLRFTATEVAAFLQQVLDISLTPAEIVMLEQRTEGWIAGLQLAVLSMPGRADAAGFIHAFSGGHAYILDYLADEVLRQQPAELRRFLQETAVLDHLSAPLCTAVTGHPDSAALLHHIYQSNLFLEALDDRRDWFRFHTLFRDVLRLQLQADQPQRVATLHRRASDWYAQAGQITPALIHALAANDLAYAADLVERHGWTAVEHGDILAVRAWLDVLPPATIQARPWLTLIQAGIFLATGQLNAAEQALAALQNRADLPADALFTGELAHFQATLARFQGDNVTAIHHAQAALQCLPVEQPGDRAAILLNLALAYIATGDTTAAVAALTDATTLAPRLSTTQDAWATQGAWQGLAWLYVRQGHLAAAGQIYRQRIAWAEQENGRALPNNGALYIGLAETLLARWELAEAQAALETGIRLLRRSTEQIVLAQAYGRLAQVQQLTGHPQAARQTLAEADAWLIELRLTDLGFGPLIASYRAWLALRQGNLKAASHWAPASGLLPDIRLNSVNELLYPILVRVLLATGDFATAQTILDALYNQFTLRQWAGALVELSLLQALTHHAWRRRAEAVAALQKAIALAQAEGQVFWFVVEDAPLADLLRQMDGAWTGTPFVSHWQRLAQTLPVADTTLPETLSDRELDVLRLVAAGSTNRQIADRLVIALPTVKKHVSNILVKLAVANRAQAIARARELDLI